MARLTASFVISWKRTRRTGTMGWPRLGRICSATCHAIASPSRSGSVAMNTSFESFAAVARFAVDFFAAARLVVVFFAAMFLVYGLGIYRGAGIVESGSLHHRAQVVERDAAIELQHRPLDHLLELRGVERSGAGEGEQVPPRLGGEAATLVRS